MGRILYICSWRMDGFVFVAIRNGCFRISSFLFFIISLMSLAVVLVFKPQSFAISGRV